MTATTTNAKKGFVRAGLAWRVRGRDERTGSHLRGGAVLEADEREAPRSLRVVVPGHVDVTDLPVFAEQFLQLLQGDGVVEVIQLQGVEAGDIGRALGTFFRLRGRGHHVVLSAIVGHVACRACV